MKNKAAQELGKLGGQVKSEAKTKAVRENGKLGGRPPKRCKCLTHIWHSHCIKLNCEECPQLGYNTE